MRRSWGAWILRRCAGGVGQERPQWHGHIGTKAREWSCRGLPLNWRHPVECHPLAPTSPTDGRWQEQGSPETFQASHRAPCMPCPPPAILVLHPAMSDGSTTNATAPSRSRSTVWCSRTRPPSSPAPRPDPTPRCHWSSGRSRKPASSVRVETDDRERLWQLCPTSPGRRFPTSGCSQCTGQVYLELTKPWCDGVAYLG